ncbi:MAG: hypothetical protein Q8R44_05130 [Novosphingobium sp.]|nr:hypothetical protein [Novosphingobium sp.]
MSLVGVAGLLLGLLALSWGMVVRDNRKLGLFVAIIVAHAITSALYYYYVQNSDADTKLYYYDPYGFYSQPFSLGTIFLIYLVQWLKSQIGGSYFDYFLLFQAIGVWGIVLLARILEELTIVLDEPWPPLLTIMVMMPGMYFWTSAISKDGPLFFACALALWATMALSRRWAWMGVAVVLMMLFRPHVALLSMIAFALALVAGRGVATSVRVMLVGLSAVAVIALAGTVQASLRIDLSSVGSIASYVDNQSAVAANASGTGGGIVTLPLPVKLFSLLYRPFFFDAGGIFGLVASVQNIFMVYATFLLIREFRVWRAMFRESLPIRFATLFLAGMVLMLSVMYYNVGLGLRQREMFTPALYLIFCSVYIVKRGQRAVAARDSRLVPDPGNVPDLRRN